MTNPILGELSYLSASLESVWGTLNGSPSWVQLPVLDYKVAMNTEKRNSALYTGLMEEKHQQTVFGMPVGQLTTPLFGWWPANTTGTTAEKSQMGFLLAFMIGSSLEATTRPNRSFFWAEGPNVANKIHTGSVCGSWTITGSAAGVVASLDISGYDEIGMDDGTARADTAPTLVTDRKKLNEVLFEDCSMTLGGSATQMKAFQIKQNFNLVVGREDSNRPTFLLAKKVVTDVNYTIRKTDDVWDAYNRLTTETEMASVLTLKGLHMGTGTGGTDWSVATLTFNRLALTKPVTEGGKDFQYLNLAFKALKPDTSSASMSYAMSEE